MQTVSVQIPEELARAAGCSFDSFSSEAVRLLALELYREDKISLGRAAELCQMAVEPFMEFSARHNAPLDHGISYPEEDRRTLDWLGL
jgi:predicted HTH domain antitoxin